MGRSLLPAAALAILMVSSGTPADASPVAYVQATVVEPNPAAGSLGFVTASGRSRVARASGRALASLRNLRPGDDVILTLEGPTDRPVVTAVKVSQLVPEPPAAETAASPYAQAATMVSSRPSWPNPYSRINPGLPLRPARATPARGGTLSVMPAALTSGAPSPARPIAAPAVLAPALAPAPVRNESSSVDALRARGARDFEAAVARLAAEARQVDSAYERYKSACPTAMAPASDGSREWFGLWSGAAARGADPSCALLLDEIKHLGTPIRVGMLAAQEAARRAWVLPGTLTDIRHRHSMEWSGWDR